MDEKQKKEFIGVVANLLADELKFYLTEFGHLEDLEEIATKIYALVQKKKENDLPAE